MTSLRRIFRKWFLDHPASVNETYWEHFRMALGFGRTLLRAGAACLIHAVFPSWFTTTASRSVDRLHGQMVGKRNVSSVHTCVTDERDLGRSDPKRQPASRNVDAK